MEEETCATGNLSPLGRKICTENVKTSLQVLHEEMRCRACLRKVRVGIFYEVHPYTVSIVSCR